MQQPPVSSYAIRHTQLFYRKWRLKSSFFLIFLPFFKFLLHLTEKGVVFLATRAISTTPFPVLQISSNQSGNEPIHFPILHKRPGFPIRNLCFSRRSAAIDRFPRSVPASGSPLDLRDRFRNEFHKTHCR